MKRNKDNPYPTKEQCISDIVNWTNDHAHEYTSGLTAHAYTIYPQCPVGCNVITLECNRTHRTVRRFYYKESEV